MEELVDTVDPSAPGELLADVCRMLTERLAKDRTGNFAEASDVSVRDDREDVEYLKPAEVDELARNTVRLRDELMIRLLFQTGL